MRVNNASGAVNGLNGEPILTLKHVEAQMGSSVFQALLLTMMGAAGTALGGLLVIAQPTMNFRKLGALQGLAAGLMLSISLMDLLPEAAEEIGFIAANVCFYVGVLFFAAVVTLIPDPDSFITDQVAFGSKAAAVGRREQGMKVVEVKAVAIGHAARGRPALTRACSPAPGLEHAAVDAAPPARAAELSSNRPSAAACLHQSFPDGQGGSDRLQQHNCSYAAKGLAGVADGDSSLANGNADSKDTSRKLKRQLLLSGLITAVGIALHNFPEGVAVFLAAQKSPAIGVSLAVAIALHNIPEGVAVALPVYFATGSRLKGLQTAVLSGLAEPLAVILLGLLFPVQLNKHIVDCMLAGVGGIMAFLSFHELLPLALQHAGKGMAVGCMFAGMALMSFNLHLLNTYILAGLH